MSSGELDSVIEFARDYDTYDALLAALDKKPTGRLAMLLPPTLYRFLFGPQPPNSALFTTQRTAAKEGYRHCIREYWSIQRDLVSILSGVCIHDLDDVLVAERVTYANVDLLLPDQTLAPPEREAYLTSLDALAEHALALHATIEDVHSPDTLPFVRAPEQAELTVIRRTLVDITLAIQALNAKIAFDTHIDETEASVEALLQQVAPYERYERYLTRLGADDIGAAFQTAALTVGALYDAIPDDRLLAPDHERLTTVFDAFRRVRTFLETYTEPFADGYVEQFRIEYNEAFVDRERPHVQRLVSGIADETFSLTPAQEEAVIRNDRYNQVIAAAGTGKTLVLTTRVAYLIDRQRVDPARLLVVTFTREARTEMETRLATHFGITDVDIRTLHSFGNMLVQEASPTRLGRMGSQDTRTLIDRVIHDAYVGRDERFLEHYYELFVHFDDVTVDEADFATKEAYYDARAAMRYQTLKGEEVKSRAEKRIADFLFIHQVTYRYEDLATWASEADEKDPYQPDFYLPDDDLYIEHWGIDAAGEVAPWFTTTTRDYHEKMRWARRQFDAADTVLVETYEFEQQADILDTVLRHRLTAHGVELTRMSFTELVNSVYDYNKRERTIKRKLQEFIENAKQFDVKPPAIEAAITPTNPRQYHFAHCGILLLQTYQRFLVEQQLIDYSDMIRNAVALIRENPNAYRSQYDQILVDEFQDIGVGMLDLLQELTGPKGARLFTVGDDWQSIYSFQGAVVQYFIDFADSFGEPARTMLTENFRSPQTVLDAGNALIANNDAQIDKEVEPMVTTEATPFVHPLRGYQFYDYVSRVSRYTVDLVRAYLQNGATPAEIMVLCRFDDAVPYLDEIKTELRTHGIPYRGKADAYHGDYVGSEAVAVYSVYQAKGREAPHVILVHATEGSYGFPPAERRDDLLSPVQPIAINTLAEERRAFYVAITRAERTLDILTRFEQESRFLAEIEAYTEPVDQTGAVEPLDDVGSEMSVTATVAHLYDDLHPKKHQDGILVDRYGGSARFVSWASSDPPTLVKGKWYCFEGVKVSAFNDRKELVVTSQSSISTVDPPQPSPARLRSHPDETA